MVEKGAEEGLPEVEPVQLQQVLPSYCECPPHIRPEFLISICCHLHGGLLHVRS